jgi:hypothetical protein
MKIEISQYKPSVIRKARHKSYLLAKWWEGFTGIELFNEKLLGISLHKSTLMVDPSFEYKRDNLSIWIYILSWPINIDF